MNRFILIVLLIILSQMTGCAAMGVFKIPQIEGRVVDAQTGEPIEGAVVVVRRGLKGGAWSVYSEGGTAGYYPYQEAVTDKSGNYLVPSKGIVYAGSTFSEGAPELIIFKAGYDAKFLGNYCPEWHEYKGYPKRCKGRRNPSGMIDISWYQDSIWSGEVIRLDKFSGTMKEYSSVLLKLNSELDATSASKDKCTWLGFWMPKMLRSINQEMHKYGSSLLVSPESQATRDRDCPKQWEEFFKEFNQ